METKHECTEECERGDCEVCLQKKTEAYNRMLEYEWSYPPVQKRTKIFAALASPISSILSCFRISPADKFEASHVNQVTDSSSDEEKSGRRAGFEKDNKMSNVYHVVGNEDDKLSLPDPLTRSNGDFLDNSDDPNAVSIKDESDRDIPGEQFVKQGVLFSASGKNGDTNRTSFKAVRRSSGRKSKSHSAQKICRRVSWRKLFTRPSKESITGNSSASAVKEKWGDSRSEPSMDACTLESAGY